MDWLTNTFTVPETELIENTAPDFRYISKNHYEYENEHRDSMQLPVRKRALSLYRRQ